MENQSGIRAQQPDYILVDLPVQLSPDEFEKLAAATSNAARQKETVSPFQGPDPRVARAIERVTATIALRKRREEQFGADIFGEPAWDILLDLFLAKAEARKTSSMNAAVGSRAPTTTALRYLNILQQRGLIAKSTGEHDHRVHNVQLTNETYRAMMDLFAA